MCSVTVRADSGLDRDDARSAGEFRTTPYIVGFVMAPVSRLVRNSKPNVDGVVARVSVDVWNAKRRFLERVIVALI